MTHTLYIITNTINNKSYVGYTAHFEKRIKCHKNCSDNNCPVFYKAIRKYGWDKFTIKILLESEDDILYLEPKYIKEYNTRVPFGYNVHSGGARGDADAISKKLSGKTGKQHHMYGKKHSPETIAKMKSSSRPRWTEESRLKLSNKRKGEGNPMYGKTFDDVQRKAISERTSGKNNPMYGRVGSADHLNNKLFICEHCQFETSLGNYKRWHSDNCRHKNKSII